ncbi:MAG: hypothetical protein ACP5XB_07160 [Isosphaeraceae bacterium]
MKRSVGAISLATLLGLVALPTRADETQVNQVLDKAIKALGGRENLAKANACTWKARGKVTIEGNENEFHGESTVQGIDHFHSTFEGEFNGNPFKALTVLCGDKGWRKFGEIQEMNPDAVKNEKRTVYLMVVPTMVVPLKSKDFKVQFAADEKINDKPVATLKVTGPDGKDFTLSFDKESGLPVRMVARVAGWMGDEYVQEVHYSDYKDFGGLKRPTKIVVKRDGEPFVSQEITEFQVLDKVPAETFAEPK